VTQHIDPRKIAAIELPISASTICFWDRQVNEPLARAIVWQDRRTASLCEELRAKGTEPFFQSRRTFARPLFFGHQGRLGAQKIGTLSARSQEGRWLVGTIDSFLIAKLSGGAASSTEPATPSRTLASSDSAQMRQRLVCRARNPHRICAKITTRTGTFALTGDSGAARRDSITGVLGISKCALGSGLYSRGAASATYGPAPSCFSTPDASRARASPCGDQPWPVMADGSYTYALEGSAFIAGAAVSGYGMV